MKSSSDPSPSHGLLRDLLLLTTLCAALYLPGLTSFGLSNWQEAQRAIVAREMQARGDWLVPTADGRPYLAKPPMIYWCQMTLAAARGGKTGELELRLTVALAGWLGVLATYAAARRLLAGVEGVDPAVGARWAAAFLATGFLYFRSSRLGELDILLVPFTIVAVAAVFEAWRQSERARPARWAWLGLATLAGIGAALTKGPPAVLAVAVASYGGVLVWCANSGEAAPGMAPPARRAGALVGGAVLLVAVVAIGRPQGWREWAGAALLGCLGAALGASLVGLANPRRARECLRLLSRTHPLIVLGGPLLAYGGWLWAASRRIGPDAVAASFEAERLDNLRLLVPESPVNNLEAAAYGAGLGSLCAAAALVWMARRRVGLGPALCVLLAWVVGGFIAFSLLGKGVPRYLTPLWPGMAMLGAAWFAGLVPRVTWGPWARGAMVIGTVVLGGTELWWYGWGMAVRQADRSPRALVRELLEGGVDPHRLGTFEFDTPAVDFYAGCPVPSYLDIVPRPGMVGVGPRTVADLRRDLEGGGEAVLLVRRSQPEGQEPVAAAERVRAAGLATDEMPVRSAFVIDNGRAPVVALRVRAR